MLVAQEDLQKTLQVVQFRHWIALMTLSILVIAALCWSVVGRIPTFVEGRAIVFDPERMILIRSELDTHVVSVAVNTGGDVAQGSELIVLGHADLESTLAEKELIVREIESFPRRDGDACSEGLRLRLLNEKADIQRIKNQLLKSVITAPVAGRVVSLAVEEGMEVKPGTVLMWIEQSRDRHEPQSIYGVIPFEEGAQVAVGMKAKVELDSADVKQYGYLLGVVEAVLPYLTSVQQSPLRILPIPKLNELFTSNQAFVIVKIRPTSLSTTASSYAWTSRNGPPFAIAEGTLGRVDVILGEKRPLSILIPGMEW
jgi:multidrug resistance efflux pump